MLSAFHAQPIHELKQGDKSKIESVLAYGDRLLVGLNNGALRIYRVNESAQSADQQPVENGESKTLQKQPEPALSPTKGNATKIVELLREVEKFSKKPVQQLAIIKEVNLLVSLSDGYVSLNDLQTYQPVEKLDRTKGATCFAVTSNVVKDADTNIPSLVSRLAVGLKKKILCWTWLDMELQHDGDGDVQEVNMEASVKSLTWATGTKLIVGMDPGFSVVDVETLEIAGVTKPANPARTNSDPNPAVSEDEAVRARFGAVSSSGMGYMGMGSWVPKPMATALYFSSAETHVLLAKDVNTLFVSSSGTALPKRQVPWSLAPEAIGYSYPYLLALQPPDKGNLQIRNPDSLSLLQTIAVPNANILHVPQPNISLAHAGKGFLVASERCIWRMNALPYDSQLSEMVENQRFDEAVSLLSLLEDTLIEDKPGRIREIQSLKAETLFQQKKYRSALDLFTDAETSPDRVIRLYPRSIAGEPSAIESDSADNDNAVDDRPQTNGGKAGKAANSPTLGANKPLEGEELKLAVRSLLSFLASARKQIQKYLNGDGTLKEDPPKLNPETGKPAFANLLPSSLFSSDDKNRSINWQNKLLKTAQFVDTTLFLAYTMVQPSLAGSLFRLDNFCDPDVVQSSLYESEHYTDLIDFLRGKKLHRQALELLTKFGKEEGNGKVPAGMEGVDRTVAYLKQLPPECITLILEFAGWPLKMNSDEGMQVFVTDSWEAENLPRKRVVDFLAEIDRQSAGEARRSKKLEVWYLEHIINELDDKTGDFLQRLVDDYIAQLKNNTIEDETKRATKMKLENLLSKSQSYDKVQTFRQLPSDDALFYESRALVLSAMGSHKQALEIYVFQIHDYAKAEEYCNRTYLSQQAEQQQEPGALDNLKIYWGPSSSSTSDYNGNRDRPNIFATLLGLYLRPPSGEEKRWPQALEVLSKHGSRLPASSTLDLMPDDLSIADLSDYFKGRLRIATSVRRLDRITASLESVRKVNTERRLLLGEDALAEKGKVGGRSKRARIGEEDHCKVCRKRFGASAVRIWPSGEVVHYGCFKGRSVDGSTDVGLGRKTGRGWG